MMGFDADTFDRILEKFGLMFSGHTPFDPCETIVEFECVCACPPVSRGSVSITRYQSLNLTPR